MLIDDALEQFAEWDRHPPNWMGSGGGQFIRRNALALGLQLRVCPIYILDEACAVFLDQVGNDDIVEAAEILATIKLPHPFMAIEYPYALVASARRKARRSSPGDDAEYWPGRLMVLLYTDDQDRINAAVVFKQRTGEFGSMVGRDSVCMPPPLSIPVTALRKVGPVEGDPRHAYAVDTYWLRDYAKVMLASAPNPDQRIQDGLISNWLRDVTSEMPMILTFLLFLATPDDQTIRHASINLTKLNKARARTGKALLRNYTHLSLGVMGHRHLDALASEREPGGPRRAHWVRGHMFSSHGRMVWRRPHVRGVNADGSTEPTASRIKVSL